MGKDEIEFLRSRIADEHRMAAQADCASSASAHLRLARLYERRLETEAIRIVQDEVERTCACEDPRMAAVLRLLGA